MWRVSSRPRGQPRPGLSLEPHQITFELRHSTAFYELLIHNGRTLLTNTGKGDPANPMTLLRKQQRGAAFTSSYDEEKKEWGACSSILGLVLKMMNFFEGADFERMISQAWPHWWDKKETGVCIHVSKNILYTTMRSSQGRHLFKECGLSSTLIWQSAETLYEPRRPPLDLL